MKTVCDSHKDEVCVLELEIGVPEQSEYSMSGREHCALPSQNNPSVMFQFMTGCVQIDGSSDQAICQQNVIELGPSEFGIYILIFLLTSCDLQDNIHSFFKSMFFNQIVSYWAARALIILLLGLITQIMSSLGDGSLCSAQ